MHVHHSAMSAQSPTGPDPIRGRALHEYRLSLGLLAAGLALVAGLAIQSLWYRPDAGGDVSTLAGLARAVGWTAGGMLILLAGTVAYYHRSFLRERRHVA